jgi:hypothetical protein
MIPPVLLRHIRKWKRLGLSKRYVVEFNGRPVKRVNKGFRHARQLAGLGADVTPHILRHTCATWMAQRRVPIHEICGFLGMTRRRSSASTVTITPIFRAMPSTHSRNAPDRFRTASRAPNVNRERRMSSVCTENVEFFRLARQRPSFGTRGSQVQILPLRPILSRSASFPGHTFGHSVTMFRECFAGSGQVIRVMMAVSLHQRLDRHAKIPAAFQGLFRSASARSQRPA